MDTCDVLLQPRGLCVSPCECKVVIAKGAAPYLHTHLHACMLAFMHACMHAYIHTYIDTCILTYMHANSLASQKKYILRIKNVQHR